MDFERYRLEVKVTRVVLVHKSVAILPLLDGF